MHASGPFPRAAAIGVLVAALAVFDVWLGLSIDTRDRLFLASDVGLAVSFAVPGLIAVRLRSTGTTGRWMLILGLTMLVETPYGFVFPADTPGSTVIVAVGEATYWLQYAIAGRMLLGYPTGALPGRAERAVVAVAFGLAAAGSTARLVALGVSGVSGYRSVTAVLMLAWVCLGVLAAVLIGVRLRRSGPIRRRDNRFAVVTAAVAILVFVAAFTYFAAHGGAEDEQTTAILYAVMAWTIVAAIPATFFVRLLREHLAFASLGDLARRLERATAETVEQRLAGTLRDPGLRVVFPTPAGPVDVDGNRFEPATAAGLATTPLGAPPIALLLHDPDLSDHRPLLLAAANAAWLALDNARLRAEVLAQLNEVRASRRRIATAADTQRRRLERDLHDGAQQRLLGIGCSLGVLRTQLSDPAQRATVEDLERQLRGTIADLRTIAHGLRPPILTDQGLAPALAWLSRRTDIRVRLDVRVTERTDPIIEATAYDLIRETLHEAGRRSGDPEATVYTAREGDLLTIEVTTTGGGGAGYGLTELTDRVGAVGGHLAATGTRLRAELPWTS